MRGTAQRSQRGSETAIGWLLALSACASPAPLVAPSTPQKTQLSQAAAPSPQPTAAREPVLVDYVSAQFPESAPPAATDDQAPDARELAPTQARTAEVPPWVSVNCPLLMFDASEQLAHRFDSIAIYGCTYTSQRNPELGPFRVVHALGEPCRKATQKAACRARADSLRRARISAPGQLCRGFVISVTGDTVSLIDDSERLLRWMHLPIDTQHEALLIASMNGLQTICSGDFIETAISESRLGYAVRTRAFCNSDSYLFVRRDGHVEDVELHSAEPCEF